MERVSFGKSFFKRLCLKFAEAPLFVQKLFVLQTSPDLVQECSERVLEAAEKA